MELSIYELSSKVLKLILMVVVMSDIVNAIGMMVLQKKKNVILCVCAHTRVYVCVCMYKCCVPHILVNSAISKAQ
jgi:hypothetical protein